MMPPKKSLAARTSTTSPVKNDDHVNGKDSEATVEKRKLEENMAPVPQRNIFTEKLVEGKRKRCIPVGQEMLNEWLTTNFEKSETDELSANDTYDHYVTACIAANNTVPVKFEQLKKTLSELFGVGFTVKDNSVYKGVIRKRRKKKKSDATKVQADTLKLKMKDILETTFTKLGNVKKGLRFRMILQSIAVNYPALRIELHPTMLKRALERGMYSGNVECLRGIGACGYYRLTTEDDDDDEEDDVEEKKESDADAGEENTEDGKESKSEDDKEVEPKKAKGPIDGSGDASDSGKTKQGKEKKSTKTSSKSKNKRKRAAAPKHKIVHGQPQRIEDCFPMAMTYMTEPKEASIGKIKKYLIQHYNVQREDKMKEATKYGIESGYWEQVTGTGFSGRLQLTVEKYNPGDDRDMCGKIMNAIVACTEPKSCSAMLLRKYIGAYHPQFNVLEKLNVFKHSLQRAIHKGIIRQLSGIGATGSFQLMVSFTPSPTILAGKDNEDDYASSDSEIMSKTINEVELYRDAYVPRPTKRRGHGRQTRASSTTKPVTPARNAPTIRREPPKNRSFQKALEPKKRGRTARSGNDLPKKSPKHAKPQRKGRSPSFSEDDVPAVKGKSPRRSQPQKRVRSPSSSEDDMPEVKGKSSRRSQQQKRARSPSSSEDDVPTVKGKSSRRSRPQKRAMSPSSSEDDVPTVKGKSSRRSQPQKRDRSLSSSEDDVPTVKIKSPRRSQPQKRARSPSSSEDDMPEVKGKSPRRSQPQKRAMSPSSSEDDVPAVKVKSPSHSQPQKRARSPSPSNSESSGPTEKRKSRPRRSSKKINVEYDSAEDNMSDAVESYTPRPTKSRSISRTPQSASPKKTPVSRALAKKNSSRSQQVTIDSSDEGMSDPPEMVMSAVQKNKPAAKKGSRKRVR